MWTSITTPASSLGELVHLACLGAYLYQTRQSHLADFVVLQQTSCSNDSHCTKTSRCGFKSTLLAQSSHSGASKDYADSNYDVLTVYVFGLRTYVSMVSSLVYRRKWVIS